MIRGVVVLTLTLLVVALIPFAGPVVVIITPLPIIFFYSRLGRARGVLALAVACIIALVVIGLLDQRINVDVLLSIALTGAFIAELLRRRYSIEKTFAIASAVLFFTGVGFILAAGIRNGSAPWRIVELAIGRVIAENLRLYEDLNISADQIALIRDNAPQIAGFLTVIFPALLIAGAVLTVWLNVLAARSLLSTGEGAFPDFGDLSRWKAPEWLVWLLIAGGVMTLVPIDAIDGAGVNILILCCLIYLLQGLAIVSFFFKHKRAPRLLRWLFYLFIAVQHYMVLLVIAFGLFDMWVDFRKRISRMNDATV